MRAVRHLIAGLAWCGSAGFAAEGAAPDTALSKLRQTGEVSCQPSRPFFCGNMHVSCSGQTTMETFAFKLRATLTHGSIESTPQTDNLQRDYENGRVEWDREGAYVLVLPRLTSGYINLHSDGTYSFRIYSQHGAAMSTGRCR